MTGWCCSGLPACLKACSADHSRLGPACANIKLRLLLTLSTGHVPQQAQRGTPARHSPRHQRWVSPPPRRHLAPCQRSIVVYWMCYVVCRASGSYQPPHAAHAALLFRHCCDPFCRTLACITGGPVYCSDKPGQHDFDLLRRLVLPNGSGTLQRCLPAQHWLEASTFISLVYGREEGEGQW